MEDEVNEALGATGQVLSATRNGSGWSFTVRATTPELYEAGLKKIEEEYNKRVDPAKVMTEGWKPQDKVCKICGKPAVYKEGVSKAGKAYHGLFCSADDKHIDWSYKE